MIFPSHILIVVVTSLNAKCCLYIPMVSHDDFSMLTWLNLIIFFYLSNMVLPHLIHDLLIKYCQAFTGHGHGGRHRQHLLRGAMALKDCCFCWMGQVTYEFSSILWE